MVNYKITDKRFSNKTSTKHPKTGDMYIQTSEGQDSLWIVGGILEIGETVELISLGHLNDVENYLTRTVVTIKDLRMSWQLVTDAEIIIKETV